MSRLPAITVPRLARRRRWPRIVLVVLLLILGGVGYWWLFLRFPVVSRQQLPADTGILFSACNMGYPALLGEKSNRVGAETVHWLDEHGRPQPANVGPYYPGRFRVSPHRNIAARLEPHTTSQQQLVLAPPGARLPRTITHRKTYYNTIRWVGDDGSYCTCDDRLFDAQGRPIAIPPGFRPTNFLCADSRFLALESHFAGWSTRPYREKLLIYDRITQRFVATPRYKWRIMRGMIFHAGDRFLAVPEIGEAIVFTGDQILGCFGAPYAHWRWGEDGSAWASIQQKPKILCWRAGACRLVPFPKASVTDPGALALTFPGRDAMPPALNAAPGYLAVWGDGKYTAVAETVPIPTLQRQIMQQWIRHSQGIITMNYRRVTLYRNGRRVGSCRLPMEAGSMIYLKIPTRTPSGYYMTSSSRLTAEHLAFTADGKHLAWLLQEGGTLSLTVFAVR